MSQKTALLIVDVQRYMFDEEMTVHNADGLLNILAEMAARARAHDVPVIYIRHGGNPGEPDEPGTPGWEIHPALAPKPGEWIIDKTTRNTFDSTDLHIRLAEQNIGTLVMGGIQTENCVSATLNGALNLNYKVILVADGHTTFDIPGERSAADIIAQLNGETGAKVMPAAEIPFR